ncbi:MAG: hypothetical protein LUH46_08555, partial [Alistipes sp.]|nr:hypothetical protein [Alistipes sp.]
MPWNVRSGFPLPEVGASSWQAASVRIARDVVRGMRRVVGGGRCQGRRGQDIVRAANSRRDRPGGPG